MAGYGGSQGTGNGRAHRKSHSNEDAIEIQLQVWLYDNCGLRASDARAPATKSVSKGRSKASIVKIICGARAAETGKKTHTGSRTTYHISPRSARNGERNIYSPNVDFCKM